MIHYIDSSFLLTILLAEEEKDYAVGVWANALIRVSSILLEAESLITTRRAFERFRKELPSNWLKEKESELKNLIDEVEIRIIDKDVIETIRVRKDLCDCRSLDAIHLATAIEVKSRAPYEVIYICSYDKNIRKISRKMGFGLCPENISENF